MFLYGENSPVPWYDSLEWQQQHEMWDVNMKRWFKDLRVFEQIDGAGHWLQLEAAELVTGKLIGFLDSVRGNA